MVGTPLACAVAAGLAIFRIADELPLAALAAAPLLARRIRAGGLLRVKSGWFELPLTKTASQVHPYRVTAISRTPPPGGFSKTRPEARPSALEKIQLGKNNAATAASKCAAQLIGRLTAPQFMQIASFCENQVALGNSAAKIGRPPRTKLTRYRGFGHLCHGLRAAA
jgi:hypothetical protein